MLSETLLNLLKYLHRGCCLNQPTFASYFADKPVEDVKADETESIVPKEPSLIGKAVVLPALDQSFDAKQDSNSQKKHDSIKLLRELSAYFSDHLERKKNRYQWRQAAIVLNRLFLIILCISIVMSIVLVFLAR